MEICEDIECTYCNNLFMGNCTKHHKLSECGRHTALTTKKESVADVTCNVGLSAPSDYEINCAMGLILNSSRNLHYWFMAKAKEDMKTNLKLLKEGVERLEKELGR